MRLRVDLLAASSVVAIASQIQALKHFEMIR
jgi:hypothetical protein